MLGVPVEEIGADDNLLDHGIDSIRIMSLVERWRRAGREVTFVALAEKPTPADWWAMLSAGVCRPCVIQGTRSLPLSAAQAGIWLGQQLDPSNPAYNTGECIEILGAVDPAAFERAVRLAVGEAEALHARFVMDGDEPRQVLSPSTDWEMPVIDLSAAPDPWQAAHAWMMEDLGGTVIDLAQGPLFAQALFKAADDRWFWYQRIHHIAMDGFGYSLLARQGGRPLHRPG